LKNTTTKRKEQDCRWCNAGELVGAVTVLSRWWATVGAGHQEWRSSSVVVTMLFGGGKAGDGCCGSVVGSFVDGNSTVVVLGLGLQWQWFLC
jgi:hypothetical protein